MANSARTLKQLLANVQLKNPLPLELQNCEVVEITVDSRQAKNGSLFVAIRGVSVDGNEFIKQALEKGAFVAGSWETEEISKDLRRNYIQLDQNDREAWALICANHFGYQATSYDPKVIAITGTDGKTTTCWLLYQILRGVGARVSLLSTVGTFINGKQMPSLAHTTTPDAFHVFKFLDQARESDFIILETTSYGELHKRTFGIEFNLAAITNLADDHLTQHHTLENYALAKRNLLLQGKKKLVNLSTLQHNRHLFAGLGGMQEWNEEVLNKYDLDKFKKALPGKYNLQNLSLALEILNETGRKLDQQKVQALIDQLHAPAGRVNRIDIANGVTVFVDYAHTPQGIEAILSTMQSLLSGGGRLHCLFGAEERSYPAKRPKMGKLAAELADFVYLIPTSAGDEPLEEINAAIRDGIASVPGGMQKLQGEFSTRAAGVAAALKNAVSGDIITLLGMGHETYEELGETFTDADLVARLSRS